MIEVKNGVDSWVPVRIVNTTGAGVAGIAFGSVTATACKAGGTTANISPAAGADWVEVTAGAFAGTGVYQLKILAAVLNTNGVLEIAVTNGVNVTYVGAVKVVANEEYDTYTSLTGGVTLKNVRHTIRGITAIENDGTPPLVLQTATAASALYLNAGAAGTALRADGFTHGFQISGRTHGIYTYGGVDGTLSEGESAGFKAQGNVGLDIYGADNDLFAGAAFPTSKITDLHDALLGEWKIFTSGPDANRLVLYRPSAAVLKKFDLQDSAGNPTSLRPYRRVPV